ncbi:uncharacterized protein LOC126743165 [Anthonomus grandis grandis]|uniref:uncharacterized protein LOC126743165 n=1 Tax=Anthonomus grandis grandis TaxID=2921223 RepID=UPI00216544AF|nr:uncharacterized protein LOC126743165 [Anthonomus grandis grandis]
MTRFSERSRLRFSIEQDMQLLQEVLKQNPFENVDKWKDIHENFVNECNIPFSLRTCKDHANHLINLHLRGNLKMRPREMPEDFEKKKEVINEIIGLRNQISDIQPKRPRRQSGGWDGTNSNETIYIKQEGKANQVKQEDSDDDFYWEEENERDKQQKEREANDVDGKLRKRELALDEREITLRENQLKLEEERLELDKLEKSRRTELEEAEREAFRIVATQNQSIITSLMDSYNRRNGGSNLCIL